MIQDHVTSTELARNLPALLDQVRVSGKRIAITRGNREIAQLGPPTPKGASADALKVLLTRNPRMPVETTAYVKDLNDIRNAAALPPSPWES